MESKGKNNVRVIEFLRFIMDLYRGAKFFFFACIAYLLQNFIALHWELGNISDGTPSEINTYLLMNNVQSLVLWTALSQYGIKLAIRPLTMMEYPLDS